MSSSSNPPAGGNNPQSRNYICRKCSTNITLNPSLTSFLLCRDCHQQLTQQSHASTSTSRPLNTNAEPFISRQAMLEHQHHNYDYINVITESNFFTSPYPNSIPFLTPLSTDGSIISFLSLCEYMNYCLNEGVIINTLSWGVIKWHIDVKMTEDVLASNGADCSICTENFKIGEEAKQLPCRHLYHNDCIVSWIEKSDTCPICRLKLTRDMRFSSVTSGEMRGSGEQILAEHISDNMLTIFEIELQWPVNSRLSRFDESEEDSGSN